jgi:purine-binding chemotaxis protein CheW
MTDAAITTEENRHRDLDGGAEVTDDTWAQYVTFTVDDRSYGVEITKVREIKGWTEPTQLPNSPYAMRGVLNLRGEVIPIFDLRSTFGQGVTEVREEHVVIIVAIGDNLVGILVDTVSDILTLEPGEVLPVPDTGGAVDQRFLSGLVSRDDRFVALLKLEELFGI